MAGRSDGVRASIEVAGLGHEGSDLGRFALVDRVDFFLHISLGFVSAALWPGLYMSSRVVYERKKR